MKLSQPVCPTDAVRCLKHWFQELSSDPDGMKTLQHDLIDALLSLRHQANKDGWMNWGGNYEEMTDLLLVHLPVGEDAERIHRDIRAIREAGEKGADEGRFAYEEIDRLCFDLLRWCQQRREWIRLPEGYHFWADVPASALAEPEKSMALSFNSLFKSLRNILTKTK